MNTNVKFWDIYLDGVWIGCDFTEQHMNKDQALLLLVAFHGYNTGIMVEERKGDNA